MKIAVEKREDRWLAQVVHIGNNIGWSNSVEVKWEMKKWVRENCQDFETRGWQFYFTREQDLTLFILRWS